jgi:hypothetical protein
LGSNNEQNDLGWRNRKDYNNNGYDDAIKLAALYQWVWNIDGGFNWYAGVGGGVGTFGRDYDNRNYNNEAFVLLQGHRN